MLGTGGPPWSLVAMPAIKWEKVAPVSPGNIQQRGDSFVVTTDVAAAMKNVRAAVDALTRRTPGPSPEPKIEPK